MPTTSLWRSLIVLGVLGTGSVRGAQRQSLADVARQEQERRKSVTQPSKVYRNADVTPDTFFVPPSSNPSASPPTERPSSFVALVSHVVDGDTIDVTTANGVDRLRLHGIDAPERGQPYWVDAAELTRRLVGKQFVTVTGFYRDSYGRLVSRVISQGKDVNFELIEAGLAWHDTEYSSDATFAAAEQAARRARLGLWVDPDPVPPSDARRTRPPQRLPTQAVTADGRSPGANANAPRRENGIPSESTPVQPVTDGGLWQVQPPFIVIPIGPTCGVNTPREQALANAVRGAAGFGPGGSGQPCVDPAGPPPVERDLFRPRSGDLQ